jgi:hypothetical protein
MANKVLLLEFNELCPSLMHKFISEGHLPNFEQLHGQSFAYVTDAQEPQKNLEPWILWVNVHTGVPFAEHGILNLGDEAKLKHQSLWDIANSQGKSAWICGSMNVKYKKPFKGNVLPDPWSTTTKPNTRELEPFFNFVRTQVQEHTNDSLPLTRQDYLRFVKFMASHGLSIQTAFMIATQLLKERFKDERWKRAILLDRLQWDVFRWYFRQIKPDLSTFFINSTAHFQHKYWRNMDPDSFSVKPSQAEQNKCDAILFGYKQMDRIVGEALRLIDPKTALILVTALSQQPFLGAELKGGKRFYRPRSFEKMSSLLQITGIKKIVPVMSEQFHIYFVSEKEAKIAQDRLDQATVKGEKAIYTRRDGNDLFAGCNIFHQLPSDAVLSIDSSSLPFFDLFYQADSLKSGMHHPDGIFWVRTPARQHRVVKEKVSLLSVAPTVLKLMGLKPHPQMIKPAVPTSEREWVKQQEGLYKQVVNA